jgi:hypothetical protein
MRIKNLANLMINHELNDEGKTQQRQNVARNKS